MGGGFAGAPSCHPASPSSVHLAIPGPPDAEGRGLIASLDKGGMAGLGLSVDDCRKTFEELKPRASSSCRSRGRPYGVEAVMRDNSGNWMVLVEPKAFTPADFE